MSSMWRFLPLVLALASCDRGSEPEVTPEPKPEVPRPALAEPVQLGPMGQGETPESRVAAVARAYASWQRIAPDPKWAPPDCAPPWPPPRGDMERSRVATEEQHGGKLYYLFAADAVEYRHEARPPPTRARVGQALVKQAFTAERVGEVRDKNAAIPPKHAVAHNTDLYRAGQPIGLFVMNKVAEAAEGTDDGWIYGVVAADGKTVTEAGRVETCAGCHRNAKRDRVFGWNDT